MSRWPRRDFTALRNGGHSLMADRATPALMTVDIGFQHLTRSFGLTHAPAAVDLSAAACSPTRGQSVAAPHPCGRHLAYDAGSTPTLTRGQTGSLGLNSPIPRAIW